MFKHCVSLQSKLLNMVFPKDPMALLSDDISKDETICKGMITISDGGRLVGGFGLNKQLGETFQIDFINI